MVQVKAIKRFRGEVEEGQNGIVRIGDLLNVTPKRAKLLVSAKVAEMVTEVPLSGGPTGEDEQQSSSRVVPLRRTRRSRKSATKKTSES